MEETLVERLIKLRESSISKNSDYDHKKYLKDKKQKRRRFLFAVWKDKHG